MAALATAADLAGYLGHAVYTADSAEEARAVLLLDLASGLVRSEAGQQISLVEDDEVTLDGSGTALLLLPELPVVEVTEVTVDDVETDDWTLGVHGVLTRPSGAVWPLGSGNVVVAYDHGQAVPDEVRAVVLAVAGRAWQQPGPPTVDGLVQPPSGMVLLPQERAVVRRFAAWT